jgi:hypothetical protein
MIATLKTMLKFYDDEWVSEVILGVNHIHGRKEVWSLKAMNKGEY